MWPTTVLQDLLSIEHPIIQAPMGGAVDLAMASAVTRAGAFGSLACAGAPPKYLRSTLQKAREETDLSINVNFFAHQSTADGPGRDETWLAALAPYFDEYGVAPPNSLDPGTLVPFNDALCSVIEELTPKVVSFHFGLPADDFLARVKKAGALVISSATTVEEAVWLEEKGCDAIVAQGYEAGGHRGMFLTKDLTEQIGTFALVPQVVDAVRVPVIAAGGIADGRGIAAALALGAAGVQIGTAYLFTEEATIDEHYRTTLASDRGASTVVTNVISGRPTRIARTRLTQEEGPISDDAPEFPRGFPALMGLKERALARGRNDFSSHYTGQAAPLGRPTTARELTEKLVRQAQETLHGLSAGVRTRSDDG